LLFRQWIGNLVARELPATAGRVIRHTAGMTKRGVTVVGLGRIGLPADGVSVNVGVEVYGETPASALAGVTAGLARLTGVLRAGGIADDAFMTSEVVVRPHWDHGLPPEPYTRLWGSGGLIVRLTTEQAAGGLLNDLLDSPEARLHSLVMRIVDRSAAYERALTRAFEDAHVKAARLAELSGARLGAVQSVTEGAMSPRSGQPMTDTATFSAGPASGVALVEGGANELTASVTVTWRLEERLPEE
jgi:uncharacterized protein YggE